MSTEERTSGNSVCSVSTSDVCPLCHSPLIQKRLKYFCTQCGQLCETCCDGGKSVE